MPHWNHLGRESLVRPCLAPGLVPKFLPGAAWCRSSDSCLFLYLWTQRFVTSTLVPKLFPDLKMIANFSILMNNNTFYDICHKIPPARWITLDNIYIRCWSNWLIQVYIPHHKCDIRSEVLLVLVNHHHIMNIECSRRQTLDLKSSYHHHHDDDFFSNLHCNQMLLLLLNFILTSRGVLSVQSIPYHHHHHSLSILGHFFLLHFPGCSLWLFLASNDVIFVQVLDSPTWSKCPTFGRQNFMSAQF